MRGQLTRMQDDRQDQVETALANLARVMALLDHDSLRVDQAIRRHGSLSDLLGPVLDDIEDHRVSLRRVQDLLRDRWDAGQAGRWDG